jgi:hypothetical protein
MLRRIGVILCILGLVATLAACTADKTLTTKVTDLETKVAALQTKVDAATQTETTLRTDLTTAQNQVKALTARVTQVETSLQNHINPPLTLEIKSLTSPVLQGASVTLVVKTDAGARVSAKMTVPAGQTAPTLGDKTAGRNGEVTFTWKVAKTLPAGSYAIQVSGAYEGKTASQSTNLIVNAPAPAPAKTTK